MLRDAITFALIAGAGSTGVAFAQSATTDLDRVQVTGSRIRQATLETAQPIVMMTRDDIQKQGFTSVSDIIQNLTATGSPAISRADALASGEEVGGQYVDLRNLGPERTLVLIDGKRMGITSGGYSDLASIPSSVVERIEVLTDGASAVYGSDAIAGVVNIITRKNFDGLEANAYLGQYGEGDGQKQSFDFVIGTASDRGSITLGAEYTKENEVKAKDREFSAYPQGRYHPAEGWSAISEKGILIDPNTGDYYSLNPGTDSADLANYHPFTSADRSNASQQMWLQSRLERRSVFANASFDFSDNLRFVADALYTHRESTSQIAGYPYRSEAYGTLLSGDSAFNPFPGQDVDFMRRGWEVPRQTTSELTTYRFSGGLEGTFTFLDRDWDWDAGYVYNQNKGTVTGSGNFFTPNVANALGPSFIDADGVAKCGSAGAVIDGCIPWNPLLPYGFTGPGSLSNPELQRYLFLNSHDTSKTTTHIYSANLSGRLVTLPAGDLMVAAGYEHRKEDAEYNPDALKQSGLSTDLAGGPTKGGYSLDEFYLEFKIPILADMAFAKELSLDIAGRYSDYDTFGDTVNSKFSLTWRPIEDLLFRGTYATGFRAPTVGVLYGGDSETFDSYTDPCDTLFGQAASNPAVAARCAAAGVPAGFRQEAAGGVPAEGREEASNYPFTAGSNPDVQAETSKSWNFGVVYSPRAINGLDISLDWWKIKIDDVIRAETFTDILYGCYVLSNSADCGKFTRDPARGYQVTEAYRAYTNAGYQKTAGYDLGINYRILDTAIGDFNVSWKTTYVDYLESKRNNQSDTIVEQYTGWATPAGISFRVRSNLNVDWNYGDFGVSYGLRYYSGAKEQCYYAGECTRDYYSSPYTGPVALRDVGSNTFHDLQVRWNAPWNATISMGANNVFDHQGAQMYMQPGSSYPYYGGFDIGRFVYMKYQQRF
jgi:iron complex outermembrane receptor protein